MAATSVWNSRCLCAFSSFGIQGRETGCASLNLDVKHTYSGIDAWNPPGYSLRLNETSARVGWTVSLVCIWLFLMVQTLLFLLFLQCLTAETLGQPCGQDYVKRPAFSAIYNANASSVGYFNSSVVQIKFALILTSRPIHFNADMPSVVFQKSVFHLFRSQPIIIQRVHHCVL
jgi:hypothetical protein